MRILTALTASALGVLMMAACTFTDPKPEAPASPTTTWGAVSRDTAPFATHFPALGTPVTASWVKGSYGIPATQRFELPSPSSTKLDAIVELEPAVAAKLRTRVSTPDPYDSAAKPPATPDIAPELRSQLPEGPYLVGRDDLDTTYGWHSIVYVHRDRPIVVLLSSLSWATSFSG